MNDPAQGGDYDYYPTRYTGSSDNGGVHWNSGIANLAFHLLSVGGTHPRGKTSTVVTGVGIQDAAAIFYRANSVYLTPSSTFADARAQTVQAAEDLFGAGSQQATSVGQAWDAVGVAPPPAYSLIDTRSNLSDASGGTSNTFNYPTNGATAMKFVTSGGTGDADIYVRFGAAPTTTSYDCRPYSAGNNETCEFNPAQSGTYYVMIHAYSSYSGVTLNVYSNGAAVDPEVCSDGVDNDGDGSVDCADSDCAADPVCQTACFPVGAACSVDSDCCTNKCRGSSGAQTCK
ncbi:MAG TPA: M4 family metallopeptidase, partial [Myxococcaceae bacterium]|nr:M4 family metallopeptidase [Myxococcaceae bacterium]